MLNSEKYKSAEERAEAFEKWCDSNHGLRGTGSCVRDSNCHACHFEWLGLEAEEEEKPLPCPCCGGECVVVSHSEGHNVRCSSRYCYIGKTFESKNDAIANHNRVASAVAGNKDGK